MNDFKEMFEQVSPDEDLVARTKARMRTKMKMEDKIMLRPKLRMAVAVCAVCLLLATTAFAAARQFLSPAEVADEFGVVPLSEMFSHNAIEINATQISDGYVFTLLSIVTGENITDYRFRQDDGNLIGDLVDERTYAAIAIQTSDGSPFLPEEWARSVHGCVIAPLVRGLEPFNWDMESGVFMNSFALMAVIDNVLYALVEFDDLMAFADRGVYIGIIPFSAIGGALPFNPHYHRIQTERDAFLFDEATGLITPNPAFEGVNVLFELPLCDSLGNPGRAQEILAQGPEGWRGFGSSTFWLCDEEFSLITEIRNELFYNHFGPPEEWQPDDE
jgi:hypothetical protein